MQAQALHGRRAIRWCTGALLASAAVLFFYLQRSGELSLLAIEDYWGLGALVLVSIAAEAQALTIRVGRVKGRSSIIFLPLLTIVLLFGPVAACLCMAVTGPVAEYMIRRKEAIRANFNIAQWLASTAVAGVAFRVSGGTAVIAGSGSALLAQLGPFVLFGVVFLVVNNASVAAVIAISQRMPFRESWAGLVGRSGTNILYDLFVGPIAIAVAALYIQLGTVGILLAVLPLLFIRHSYLTTLQLVEANRDLLNALVKAIETRDPYTSGHSLRVSRLARRVAERMSLPSKTIEQIETAALLHDVGKIEAVYVSILRKPSTLTPEERAIIESHVTKGEEVLRKLSSVPEDVIRAVRHHHERHDGTGYPDGLAGPAIPVGAKIIAACDSVDAMLSDRPYRRALSLPMVLSELEANSGTQFDPRVVTTLTCAELLSDYGDFMRSVRPSGNDAVDPLLRRPTRRRNDLPEVAGAGVVSSPPQ